MKLRQARPLEGIAWMRSGLDQVRRQPMALGGVMGFMLLALMLLLTLPWIGAVAAAVVAPALSAGWIHLIGRPDAATPPGVGLLLAPLRSPRRSALLQLGLAHAAAVMLTLWLADLIDPGLDAAWTAMSSGTAADNTDEAAANAVLVDLQKGLVLRLALLLPTVLVFWHAPVLVHRGGLAVAKALFGSALASWRNRGAFVVYGLSWAMADLLLSLLLGGLLGLLGLGQVAVVLAVPLALLFSAAFYASLHATVAGSFDFDTAAPPSDDGTDRSGAAA